MSDFSPGMPYERFWARETSTAGCRPHRERQIVLFSKDLGRPGLFGRSEKSVEYAGPDPCALYEELPISRRGPGLEVRVGHRGRFTHVPSLHLPSGNQNATSSSSSAKQVRASAMSSSTITLEDLRRPRL